MRLHLHSIAPSLELETLDDGVITLDSMLGKTTFLAFHRFGSCSFSNLRVAALIKASTRLRDLGIHVLAVFESSVATLRASVATQRPPFVIAADPKGTAARAYGVEHSFVGALRGIGSVREVTLAHRLGLVVPGVTRDGRLDRMPAEFLLDEQGIVRLAHYGAHPTDHVAIPAVISILRGAALSTNRILRLAE